MTTIKTMSNADQVKIARSVLKAAELSSEGLDPSMAIAKVAKEKAYNPEVVRRMCEAFNTSKALAIYKEASGADRVQDFVQADSEKALAEIFKKEPTPREKTAANMTPSSYTLPKTLRNFMKPEIAAEGFEKAAVERVREERFCGDPELVMEQFVNSMDGIRATIDKCREVKFAAQEDFSKALGNLHSFFRYRENGIAEYPVYEGKIASAFGSMGWKLMSIVHDQLGIKNVKRASMRPEKIYDNLEFAPFCFVKQALDSLSTLVDVTEKIGSLEGLREGFRKEGQTAQEREALKKKKFEIEKGEVEERGKTLQRQKRVGKIERETAREKVISQAREQQTRQEQAEKKRAEREAEIARKQQQLQSSIAVETQRSQTQKGWEDLQAKKLEEARGKFRSEGKEESVSTGTSFKDVLKAMVGGPLSVAQLGSEAVRMRGTPASEVEEPELPEYEALKSKMDLELILYDLMKNDEYISKKDPNVVIELANEIIQSAPSFAKNPMALRSTLRKALEQHALLEAHDIATAAQTAKSISELRKPEVFETAGIQ